MSVQFNNSSELSEFDLAYQRFNNAYQDYLVGDVSADVLIEREEALATISKLE